MSARERVEREATAVERKYVEPLLMAIASREDEEAARLVAVLVDFYERAFGESQRQLDAEREANKQLAEEARRWRVTALSQQRVAVREGDE